MTRLGRATCVCVHSSCVCVCVCVHIVPNSSLFRGCGCPVRPRMTSLVPCRPPMHSIIYGSRILCHIRSSCLLETVWVGGNKFSWLKNVPCVVLAFLSVWFNCGSISWLSGIIYIVLSCTSVSISLPIMLELISWLQACIYCIFGITRCARGILRLLLSVTVVSVHFESQISFT